MQRSALSNSIRKSMRKILARLCLQTPLILNGSADSRDQILEALNSAGEIINVCLEQLKEFRVAGSRHVVPPNANAIDKCNSDAMVHR